MPRAKDRPVHATAALIPQPEKKGLPRLAPAGVAVAPGKNESILSVTAANTTRNCSAEDVGRGPGEARTEAMAKAVVAEVNHVWLLLRTTASEWSLNRHADAQPRDASHTKRRHRENVTGEQVGACYPWHVRWTC